VGWTRRWLARYGRGFQFLSTKESERLRRTPAIVTTNRPEMAEQCGRLRNHGSPQRYYHSEFGWNGRMDAIQAAAVLRVKLKHISDWNESRRQHAATYDRLLAGAGLISSRTSNQDSGEAPVRLLGRNPQAKHVFHQYVIRAERRNELRKFLAERKLDQTSTTRCRCTCSPCFPILELKAGDLPVSELAAHEVLALPMFPELTEAEIRWVVESIASFYS